MERQGPRPQRRRLARALRELCAELVTCAGSDEVFREIADAVEAFVARLKGQPRRAWGVGKDLEEELHVEEGIYHYGDLVDFSPLAGLANPIAPPMRTSKEDARTIGASVRFSPAYEGGPGFVHGGFVAAVFDDLLGLAQSLTGQAGMTASLKIRYRNPCPLETDLRMVGKVDAVQGRRILTKGEMYVRGRLLADAEAIFVVLDRARYLRKMRAALKGGRDV